MKNNPTPPTQIQDVLEWTRRFTDRVHNDTGMLVIPNFSGHDVHDANTLAVANLTDGFLAEGGFTMWNPIPNTRLVTMKVRVRVQGLGDGQAYTVEPNAQHYIGDGVG